jgi:hypothetical protein
MKNIILADRILCDLVERVAATRSTLDTATSTEFYAVAAGAVCTLRVVEDYLLELREQRWAGGPHG